MLFCHIGLIDQDMHYIADAFVGVRGQHIAYVGQTEPVNPESFGQRYDGTGKLLMPALYNAHAHAPMTLLRGYAENLQLQDWLYSRVFPFESHITEQDAQFATDLAIAEMVRYGCVSFSDMYYRDDARCASVERAGVKCNVSHGLTGFDETDYWKTPEAAANEHLFERWDRAADGRIRVDMCIHAEYTNTESVCREAARVAADHNAIMHVHVSETRAEVDGCRERHQGRSPVRFLADCGAFDVPALAAHCVWVDADDISILAEKNVTVACNPASNMKLASGFAPVPQMLAAGVRVALGTDGPASNNAHDMFRDLYLLSTLYKGSSADPTAITPAQALYAATRAGALAQGRDDCGAIAEGMRADLCVLDVTGPSFWPVHDMLANVAYSASGSEVVLTMCDGRVIYQDGTWPTIDVEQAQSQVQHRAERIAAQVASDQAK